MTISLPNQHLIKLFNSDDVYRVMREVLLHEETVDQEKEHFWLIALATNNRILNIELVSLGSVNATTVEPMNVYRFALIKGAVKVIFVHNHPSGALKPSEADKDLTDRLIQVGMILNIEAIDHLIISNTSFLSFADTGLFAQLKESTKWVPQYQLIERIKAEEKKIREDAVKDAVGKAEEKGLKAVELEREKGAKALKKKDIAFAKKLKKKKMPLKFIKEVTGLTEEEIRKIELK